MSEKGGPDDNAKELLQMMAVENNVDVIVTGFHGRKGKKADPTVMGTAVQFMSVHATKPCLILKDPKKRSERIHGYLYAVLVDGSEKSMHALKLAIKMMGPHDKIKTVSAAQANIDIDKVKY